MVRLRRKAAESQRQGVIEDPAAVSSITPQLPRSSQPDLSQSSALQMLPPDSVPLPPQPSIQPAPQHTPINTPPVQTPQASNQPLPNALTTPHPKSTILNLDDDDDDPVEPVDPDDKDWTPGESLKQIPSGHKPISRPKRASRRSAPPDLVLQSPPKRASKRKAQTPAVGVAVIPQLPNVAEVKQSTIPPDVVVVSTEKQTAVVHPLHLTKESPIPLSTFQIGKNGIATPVSACQGAVQRDVFVINGNGAVRKADQGIRIAEGDIVGQSGSGVSEKRIQSQNFVDVDGEKRNENSLPDLIVVGPTSPSVLSEDLDEDSLPNVPVPANEDQDDSDLPDIVTPPPAPASAIAPSSFFPSTPSCSFFGLPSLEPPAAKKPKATRAKKPAAPRGKAAANKKRPVVPETPEVAALTRKLSALQKDDLIEIIKRSVYFGNAPTFASLEEELPKPNVKEYVKVIKKLKSAIFKAMPNPRFYNPRYSSTDHYSFLRCQPALNAFAKVASEQISTISKLEDWNGALEYALSAGVVFMELPLWESGSDNYHEPRIKGQLTELLIRGIPKLSFTTARAQALLDEIEEKKASEYLSAAVTILKKLV